MIHHIWRLGRLPIHRIAAYTRPAFGLVCRYVPVAMAIGGAALVPPVAISPAFVSPLAPPLTASADASPGTVPSLFGPGASGYFAPQEAPEQASFAAPASAPFEFITDALPASDKLPLNLALVAGDLQPTFPTSNAPGVMMAGPTASPIQDVPEAPTLVLLPGLLFVLECRRRGRRVPVVCSCR